MNVKKLNEEMITFLEEKDYVLTIIVDRDRDSDGKLVTRNLNAENDVDAVSQVLANYSTCCQGYFDGGMEEEDLLNDEEKEILNKIKLAKETGENQEEAIKLIKDIYDKTMDISDYYDDVVKIEGPNGIIFEDKNIDIDGWFQEE